MTSHGSLVLLISTLILVGVSVSAVLVTARIGAYETDPRTWIVDDDGPGDFHTIQEAINAASPGDLISVEAGLYRENLLVNKSLSLVGVDRGTTVVDGSGVGTVIRISASGVNVMNFTVRNAGKVWGPPPGYGYPDSCILGNNVQNARVENNNLTGAAVCVWFAYSSHIYVSNNTVFNATYAGIIGYDALNSTLSNNIVYDCGLLGIHLDGNSNHCIIEDNMVMRTLEGMELEAGSAANQIEGNTLRNNNASIVLNGCGTLNVFRRNNMTSSQYNFVVFGSDLTNFNQDIDASNTVDGKILYYLKQLRDQIIDPSRYPNLGYLAVVDSDNIVVRNFNITANGDGITLFGCRNCTLTNLTLSGNRGPLVYGGLTFYESSDNTIANNEISNNSYGICLYHSDGNIFYHNSLVDNSRQVVSDLLSPFSKSSSGYFSVNVWDRGYPYGGNYWNDYAGEDEKRGPLQDQQGSDGIGDTPYVIDAQNGDRYPHKNLWASPMDSTPPETTVSPRGVLGDNDWYTSNVELTLSATDDTAVYETEISFDNTTWTAYTHFTIAEERNTTIYFRSTDVAGNEEGVKAKTIGIDKTAPMIVMTSPSPGYEARSSRITVTWTGSDETSGISYYQIRLDDGPWINVGVNTAQTLADLSDGSHTTDVMVVDKAGNTKQDTVSFTVNTSPILGPGYAEEAVLAAIAIMIVSVLGIAVYKLKRKD